MRMVDSGRIVVLALFTLLAGCASAPKPVILPANVEGGFTRTQSMGLRAVYSGPGIVTVTLTEMQSSGNAFEAIQKWKAEPGKVPFQKDKFFGVAEWKDLDTKALIAFVAALEKELAK